MAIAVKAVIGGVAAAALAAGALWYQSSGDNGFVQAGFIHQGQVCKTRVACCKSWNLTRSKCKKWSYCYKDCTKK